MRGIFIREQLEYKVETEGDEWQQGDTLCGSVTIKNRGDSNQTLFGLYLQLATGNFKKIKENSEKAFEIIDTVTFDGSDDIASNEEVSFPWTFELERNCTISEKAQSLHLVVGREDAGDPAGFLPATVLPHSYIGEIIGLFESSFSFVLKGQKSKKGWVDSKLKPPAGGRFPTLDYLVLSIRLDDDTLRLKYCFNVKKMLVTPFSLGVTKAKSEVEQSLTISEFTSEGYVDHRPLESSISEAISTVESKL